MINTMELPMDELEIDPIEEADRRACLEVRGRQYWSIHREIEMRPIGTVYTDGKPQMIDIMEEVYCGR